MKYSMTYQYGTQKQQEALAKKGWKLRYYAEADVVGGNYSITAHDSLEAASRHLGVVVITNPDKDIYTRIEIGYSNMTKMAWQHEDSRVMIERAVYEQGKNVSNDGPADMDANVPRGLHIGMLEYIATARLCEDLKIGRDGKKAIKEAA